MSSDDLKQLQKLWYQKLKKTGFRDIEREGSKFNKIDESRYFTTTYSKEEFEQKQEYYRLAGMFYFDHDFPNRRESEIWRLHAEGLSTREIAAKLRTPKNKINKDNVQKIITRYAKKLNAHSLKEDHE